MMSLAPYLPPTSGEAGAVMALLQVIADPKAAKQALDKMVEERKAIDAATEKQREMMAQAAAMHSKAKAEEDKTKIEMDRLASKAAADLGVAKTAQQTAERHKAEIAAAEKRVAEASDALREREQKVAAREQAAEQRARELERIAQLNDQANGKLHSREQELAMREKTLADDIAENNKWLAGLRPPRGR